jgi:futalosine hydrolase
VLAGLRLVDSAPAEPAALGPYPASRTAAGAGVTVLVGGIGPAAAAVAAAVSLALAPEVSLVLSVGIAGGFAQAGVRVGDVVLATSSVSADLGADTPAGFQSAADLGWGSADVLAPPDLLAAVRERLDRVGLAGHAGPVLTVSTVTGTAARAARLYRDHRAVAEAMEGAAVGTAADRFGCAFLELRGVSNLVGDRDRDCWDIPGALAALRRAMAASLPVLLANAGPRRG